MDEEQGIVVPDTPEAQAEEEAAFAAAFAHTRGEEAPAVEAQPAGEVEGEAPATEEEEEVAVEAPASEAPKLFAGLTEEQIAAALARSGSLQGTVDKMAGRIGQLMQQIEALRTNPPTTQQAQKALDLKLERLSGAFPELANLLREDLQGLSGGGSSGELPPAAPVGITQEQFDAALAERLAAQQNALNEKLEVRVLTILHPDWNQVIRTNEFALWRDNVLGGAAGKALMESEDASFISAGLTQFKQWLAGSKAPAPKPAPRTSRLSNAVLPSGGSQPVQSPITEEDAFIAAFNKERRHA